MIEQGPFTEAFLTHDFPERYKELFQKGEEISAEIKSLRDDFIDEKITYDRDFSEEDVKQHIIERLFDKLGWGFTREQKSGGISEKGITSQKRVDYALFIKDSPSHQRAKRVDDHAVRMKNCTTILEAKKLQAKLGHRERDKEESHGTPEWQVLRYLDRAARTNKKIGWGILTNGRFWRLYWHAADSPADKYLQIDLWQALGLDTDDKQESLFKPNSRLGERDFVLTIFALFFSPHAFTPMDEASSFLNLAQGESEKWRIEITEELSGQILDETFKRLINFMAEAASPESPDKVDKEQLQAASLTFLFRLLFILYAEDRNLLPVRDLTDREESYRDYSLREIREEIDKKLDEGGRKAFSDRDKNYWKHFTKLCQIIDKGNDDLGIPPYNGGLFDENHAPLLTEIKLSDRDFAEIFDGITRAEVGTLLGKGWINFYDLSARELGTIYEQLSQYDVELRYASPEHKAGGEWRAVPNANLRKTSGTYYTPKDLVRLILDRTLTPLAEDCEKQEDPAAALLGLKILDPAMGSGHFLVGATDWLTKRIEKAIDTSLQAGKTSSVLEDIEALSGTIEKNINQHKWEVQGSEHLNPSNLIRRMVLKRCIHGVDKSYYAVEVAKLSLWLHSFTVGAPLSYLDHHIQHGDSLFGEFIDQLQDDVYEIGPTIFPDFENLVEGASEQMKEIEQISDIDLDSVKLSESKYQALRNKLQSYHEFLSFFHALRWVYPEFWGKNRWTKLRKTNPIDGGIVAKIDAWIRAQGKNLHTAIEAREVSEGMADILHPIYALMDKEKFFPWEIAFPHIWQDVTSKNPQGGFDAIISNPPWERIKLQEVEWFAIRDEEIAKAKTASQRKKMITALKRQGNPLYEDFAKAVRKHENIARAVRESIFYYWMTDGDINYYALFVERAQGLIQPKGLTGLVTPSGLVTDKSYFEFFGEVSTGEKIACLFDFENRRAEKGSFFHDVDSRFRFLISVIGGDERKFRKTDCAFFLRSVLEIEGGTDKKTARTYKARGFSLTAKDFSLVNPNTGTAPLFKNKQDADLVLAVYRRLPALHNHTKKNLTWPVRCSTMFHMTSASHLFRTEKELTEQGFKRVANKNILHYEKKDYVPLYQGRMVYQFDHRFSTVKINTENLYNPYVTEVTTAQEHADPKFLPEPHNWIPQEEFAKKVKTDMQYFLAFRNITNATNERTMISAIAPRVGFGNSASVLLPLDEEEAKYKECLPILCANFNSLALDYIARCKLQGTNMNWYLVEQLPVIPPETLNETKIGGRTARDLVWRDSFRLTYTAHDLDSFARDQGWNREPFIWNEEERFHLRARLDALFFMLYGFTDKNDIQHILDSFAVIGKRNAEQRATHKRMGKFIFNYLDKFQGGDPNPWLSDALPYPEMGD